MKSICVIQARLGSSRLPGKVLLPLNGRTVIAEVIMRCCKIDTDDVVVAIPEGDEPLQREAGKYVDCFTGPEHDVLRRYVMASEGYDIIMRVTADCPLLSPRLCNSVLSALGENDYASNIPIDGPRTFPQGYDCEVFTRTTLLRADKEAVGEYEREHVTPFMRSGPFKCVTVNSPWPLEGRMTLDTQEDYQTIKAYFDGQIRTPMHRTR